MERPGMFNASLPHSFSLPSLAEGSEPISEAEEFMEMKSLRERGDKALKINDFSEAISCYNEALEIDDQNQDVLLARATASLQMGDNLGAQRDTEKLLSIDAESHQALRIQGLALRNLNQHKEALSCFLTALDLDPENADELTDFIAEVAGSFCKIPEDVMQSLKDMDAYKKLSEIGVNLFKTKRYKICIRILEAAQRFQTNQKGITMRILLTLANAHSALKHNDQAINLYQECLSTAVSTHDQVYQTKALVNIATLYLENKDVHQAIIYYEKLLHLEAELLAEVGSEDDLPDFWTKELQCGLHLNLSIAYKSISDMQSAVRHAKKYMYYVEKYQFQGKVKAESFHNTGMLNEILGNFNDAINNYNKYLQESRHSGDRKGMAQAYGCLGSVYATLRNWKLSITYHEQYVAMASKSEDKRTLIISNEMLGDTYMLKGDYEKAVKCYETMLNVFLRTDYWTRATGLCKIGNAYRALNMDQYSLHFYQQACDLAEDFEFPEIETMAQYNMACIQQNSTQVLDIEQAQKYFIKLIPYYESKISEHQLEDSHCPVEYHTQLCECYDGIQSVLAKLGNKEECLQYAEAYRKRQFIQMYSHQGLSSLTGHAHGVSLDMWNTERIERVVGEQNATVLYYSLLKSSLLLWVLQPGKGIVRFYSKKTSGEKDMPTEVETLLSELRQNLDGKKLLNESENRALPLQGEELNMVRKKNEKLGKSSSKSSAGIDSNRRSENVSGAADLEKPQKSAQRRLYDLLFAPIEDILSKLGMQNHVVIVPDKCLHHCPFGAVEDFLNRFAYNRFHITCVPNLLLLDKIVTNELNQLRRQDDLQFERQQNKKGGVFKFLHQTVVPVQTPGGGSMIMTETDHIVNPKSVSNPRLLTSGRSNITHDSPIPGMMRREKTQYEEEFKAHNPWRSRTGHARSKLALIPERWGEKRSPHHSHELPRKVGSPTPVDKMLCVHSYSTLASKTSTGTDITSSGVFITQFQQVSSKERCLIFANPKLPESVKLHGKCWHPGLDELEVAKHEARAVATYLDVVPYMGVDATKEKFLKEAPLATILHIATYGCWHEGSLAFTPNPVRLEDGPPQEDSYLVTSNDILGMKLTAQLVVLSTGFSPFRKETIPPGWALPGAFLAAGAECVLVCLWPLPNIAMEKFYYHFYMAIQNGCLLTIAAKQALQALRDDDRFSDIAFWSPFTLIGKDVIVDVSTVRRAMLDQTIDKAETELAEQVGSDYLNPKSVLPQVPNREESLRELQVMLGVLLYSHNSQKHAIPELIELLDSSLKRLHAPENNQQTTDLAEKVTKGRGSLDLLKFLGFHFQAKGASLDNPYVVYPHWNKDELLIPTYDALRAMLELSVNSQTVQALCNIVPASQDYISLLVDLLSVTKHAADIQLKVSDLSVRPLWINLKIKKLLVSVGFHQIGMLLNFNRTPLNRQLLTGLLQFLLAVSQHKSQVLLYRLDVNLLGKGSESQSVSSVYPEMTKLPSLTPLILPRNQLRMSTPWLSSTERTKEMQQKIKLARTYSDMDASFLEQLQRARTWHQMTVVAQANEALAKFGRPKSTPNKLKVIPGASASQERIPVDREPMLVIPEVDQRRDYAHYVLHQRIQDIGVRHKNDLMKLYLPYVHST